LNLSVESLVLREIVPNQGASEKKEIENKHEKTIWRKATDRLFLLFFLGAPFKRYARRLWTCHRRWAPAAGCGVFFCELVPSGDPFVCCLCKTFFLGRNFFSPTDFLFPPKNKLSSQRGLLSATAAVQSKSNSHVNVYYQPVEFTSFCLVAWVCR
jgi:hypothetical protein